MTDGAIQPATGTPGAAAGSTAGPDVMSELRQLAQLRGEGPVVLPGALSPPGPGRGEPIGTIEAVNGEVLASRIDQTNATLKAGDPIYQGDIVTTRGGGVEVSFADGTVGHLGPQARMLVQEVGTGTGSTAPVVFMVNGPFSFAAPPGGSAGANVLTVRTPVASVRVEGGRLVGRAAPEAVENKFTLMRNFDGTLGRAVIATASASVVLDGERASAEVVSLFRAPSELPTPTVAQLQEDQGGSVLDWLGAPDAGQGGPDTLAGGDSAFPFVSVVLPGPTLTGFPDQPAAIDTLANDAPPPPPQVAGATAPLSRRPAPEPVAAGAESPINVTVQSSFVGSGPGPSNKSFVGTSGFDTFVAAASPSSANSVTISQDANGNVVLTDGTNTISLDGFEELDINLGTSNDSITIGDLSNTDIADSTVRIDLGAGDDTADATVANRRHVIDGGDGDDTITGSSRNDDLNGDGGEDTLKGLAGKDKINGGAGNDDIEGGADDDTITGGSGNDTIDGGTGNDTMSGGTGDDTYTVDSTSDVVTELVGEGTDTVQSSASFTLGANIENLTLTGSSNINGTGNTLANTIAGSSGNNTLDGGAGADTMSGGDGDDIFIVDNSSDTVSENAAEGTDEVQSSVSFTLGANIENLTLTGSGDIDGTGNTLANTIAGNSGNNKLDGGAGADTMSGGAGDDTFVIDDAGDVISENAGEGTDTVQSSITTTLGSHFENLTLTGSGDINGTGNSAENTLVGNSGNNTLDGGTGADTMSGGGGDDTFVVDDAGDTVSELAAGGTDTVQSSVNHVLSANVENLTLTGTAATGTGNAENNILTGNASVNTLSGLGGDDTYFVQNTTDAVVEAAGGGTDTVNSTVTYEIDDADVENLTLTGSGNIDATGNSANNTLVGNSGNNTLDGGAGADTMSGGDGDDIFIVDNSSDTVSENAAEGTDTVQSSVTFTLGTNVENLTLTGSGDINGTGNSGANTIVGNSGNNTLNGGTGADAMTGGDGDDVFVVDNSSDTVSENAAGGTDTVQSSVAFTLGANFENLTLTGSGNISGTGNGDGNTITGNSGNNTLAGLGGADTIIGGDGTDTASYAASGSGVTIALDGSAGTGGDAAGDTLATIENLTGSAFADTLTGGDFANRIDGGAGADAMDGLGGDDTYIVDDAGDTVTDTVGGTDTVEASVTFALGTSISTDLENLTLTGSGDIDGTGNALANTITGNSGDNTLDGGSGADTLNGGAGNDTYIVDNVGDTVTDSGGGTDTVESSVGFTLGSGLEHLTLTGSGDINGTGNSAANTLIGNSGNNTLNGGAGADTMSGGGGDDVFVVDNSSDTVSENAAEGTDEVQSSVSFTLGANIENLTLTGSGNINGAGNSDANTITGNSGNNTLAGLGGADAIDGVGGINTATYAASGSGVTIALGGLAGTGGDAAGDTLTNIRNLTGSSFGDVLTGDANANVINGGAGVDTMTGGAGDDSYSVDDGSDDVVELVGEGTDTVTATVSYTLADFVEILILSGSGITGTGNALDNTFFVNNATQSVAEAPGGGTDTVSSSVTFTISDADVEHLTLTGSSGINGTGNASDNTITGNAADNILIGLGGADEIVGGGGTDTASYAASAAGVTIALSGAAGTGGDAEGDTLSGVENLIGSDNVDNLTGDSGNNVLTGLGGADVLAGGDGTDTASYAGSAAVTVDLDANSGTGGDAAGDTFSSIENLVGSGNADNLTGSNSANRIDGGAGADAMSGLGGDDTYVVDDAGDTVTESGGGGTDTVESSVTYTISNVHVENLTLTGASAIDGTGNNMDNTITGNNSANMLNGEQGTDTLIGLGGDDVLDGGNGTDTLAGGAGADTLTGGDGNDDFYYGATSEGGDTLTDFSTGNDEFVFLQSAFGNLTAGTLNASNFSLIAASYDGDNGTSTAASGGTAGFVYSSADGVLSYDADGNGGAAGFTIATLSTGSVAAADIQITAASPV